MVSLIMSILPKMVIRNIILFQFLEIGDVKMGIQCRRVVYGKCYYCICTACSGVVCPFAFKLYRIATAARNAAHALPGSIVTISRTISNTVVSGSASSHQLRSAPERIHLMSVV